MLIISKLNKIIELVALSVLLAITYQIILSSSAHGLSGTSFNASNIIDDAVFYNSNSMTANQIQAFLDSKVPTCDTNGTQIYSGSTTRAQYGASRGYPAPYICLKDYTQTIPAITNSGSDLCKNSIQGGTKSAAQIILDSAKACGINPQVLIVMLQKEQSLITDTWPWPSQYDKAMGYACPDSGPNNSANCDSTYFGFFNQVYNAAKAFRRYEANPNSYNYRKHRNNTILYHPNTACGSSNVYIENQSTASLYIYTPYRPNQAALNNLYGTGDNCSAYGNRNFWRMFNDWFGPTTGSLIRTSASNSLYYTDGSRKHLVSSMEIAGEFGLGLNNVRFVSQQEIDAIPNATNPYSTTINRLVKTPDSSTVYLISAGYKFPIGSWATLVNFGFDGDDIKVMSEDALSRLITSPKNLSELVRGFSNSTVYKVENNKKKIIFEMSKLNEINTSNNLAKISDFAIGQISYGTPLVDGDYVIKAGSSIRLYKNTSYINVNNVGAYNCTGLPKIKTFAVGSFSMTNGTPSGTLSCVVEDSFGNGYIMNGTNKLALPSGHLLVTSKPNDSVINRLPTVALKQVIKNSSGKSLSVLESGKLRNIPSMAIFTQLGYNSSNISTIPSMAFNAIPNGPLKLAPGSLIKGSTSTVYVVSDATSKLTIPNTSTFNALGYSWGSIMKVDNLTLSAYTTTGSLPSSFKISSTAYKVDSTSLLKISPTIATNYGINTATLPTIPAELLSKAAPTTLTRFIKSSSSSTIYYVDAGQKRPINSWGSLVNLGGEGKIITLSGSFINSIPAGPSI